MFRESTSLITGVKYLQRQLAHSLRTLTPCVPREQRPLFQTAAIISLRREELSVLMRPTMFTFNQDETNVLNSHVSMFSGQGLIN